MQALEFPCNCYICYPNLFILKESMSHFIVLEIQNLPYIRDENTKKIRFSLQLVSHEVSSVTLNLVNRYFSWHSDKGAANDIIILLKVIDEYRWAYFSSVNPKEWPFFTHLQKLGNVRRNIRNLCASMNDVCKTERDELQDFDQLKN